jgi:L-2-hydroxyglutarate oxidase LhgO
MDHIDAVVIGAGVVGLAIARELALRGHETLILEAAAGIGQGASSRNSEVIHAGLYYPRGSLKARLCVAGRERLYGFCRERGIVHRRCGKLIVADRTQLPALEQLNANASANGVQLEWLDGAQARALEPELACAAALYSPFSGILDVHAYMLALLAEAEAHGATLSCRSEVTRLALEDDGAVRIGVNGAAPTLRARALINSAGVQAPAVAHLVEGFPPEHIPVACFAKGNYFALRGRAPFQRLVYPLPDGVGLGIHLTLDLAGRARFGPDVEWVKASDFRVDPARSAAFYAAIRRYWPALADGALEPAYAGMRAKISGPGQAAADFRIDDATRHGVSSVLNLFGIESPGLTASLALASEAVSRIG